MKIFKAVMSIYLNHLLALLISLVVVLGFYNFAENSPYVCSAITSLIYIMLLYTAVWRVGNRDGRKIPGFYPSKKMPVLLSVFTAIIPMALLIFWIVSPQAFYLDIPLFREDIPFFIGNCFVSGTPELFFRIWFLPFAAFIKNGSVFAYFMQIFILPAITFAGYYVGTKRFSIMGYIIPRLVFVKDKNK